MARKAVSVLKSLVEIRPGERLLAILMFSYLFLIIASFAVVKPVRSSLFLEQFGARNLPYIYLATALLAGGSAWIHTKLLDRFNIVSVQIFTLVFFISNLVLFRIGLSESPWFSAAFFLWVNIFTVTLNTLFWMFANHYYHAGEAKRLYGFINAGGTLGGIASGLVQAAVVRDLGTENMLLVSGGFLGICILLIYLISRQGKDRFRAADAEYVGAGAPRKNGKSDKEEKTGLKALFQARYPRYIAAALGLSLIVSTLIDYQFNVIVEQSYPGKDARTAFFSNFMAGLNGLSFVVQFFLTSQLLRRLGIGVSVLLLPLTLMGGSLWMVLQPVLAAGIFLKAADGGVRYSLEQSIRDLLYLPVPSRVMRKLKTVVDVFVQRLAKGLGSILILALTAWWALGLRALSYVAILTAVLWLGAVVLLRREYREQIRKFLQRENLPEETKLVRVLDQTTRAELLQALRSGEEEKALYSLDLLEGIRDAEVDTVLREIGRRGSPRLQARALHLLAQIADTELLPEAEQLLRNGNVDLQVEAIHYLCASSPTGMEQKLRQFLETEDLRLRAAVLACMASCGGPNGVQMASRIFQQMLHRQGENGASARRVLAMTLGHVKPPSELHGYLGILLQDSSEEVVREALLSARGVLRRDFLPFVIARLAEPRLAADALKTLQSYGSSILGTVRDYLQDATMPNEVRRMLPAVFVEMETENAARDLLRSMDVPDPQLRYAVIKALNKMKDRCPGLKLEPAPIEKALPHEMREAYHLLSEQHSRTSLRQPGNSSEDEVATIHDLGQRYHDRVETVFRLLGLLFNQQDIYTAYRGLNSPRPELRANAVELLENVLPSDVKKFVLPLVDGDVAIHDRLERLRALD